LAQASTSQQQKRCIMRLLHRLVTSDVGIPHVVVRVRGLASVVSSGGETGTPGTPSRTEWAADHLSHGMGRLSSIEMQSAAGCFVKAADGAEYLDFTSGIGVTSTGHCHPHVTEAVQRQASCLVHGQVAVGFHSPMINLMKRLLPYLPTGHDGLFFATTGAEAVENAMRLARHATGRPNMIVFQGGYHGRTVGTVSLTTSKTSYGVGFQPLMSGVHVAPFPYATQGASVASALRQVRLLLKQQSAPRDTAAMLIEPVLGEGGYVPAPPEFLQELRSICSEHGILLVCDEVQSGFGRTGSMFAHEQSGIVPDILVMAKGIASGFPLSAISSSRDLMKRQPVGSMGGTYAGNAVSCAAALATLDVFEKEKLLENASERGQQLLSELQRLADHYPILEVRGRGLMIGVEFDSDAVPAGTAAKLCQLCIEEHLLLLNTSVFEVVRFIPPLNITAAEVQLGLDRFESALKKCFS